MAEVSITDEIRIHAPVPRVWEAIKNPNAHARWHPFLEAIVGEHRLGEARTCSVTVGGKRGETTERCIEEDEERTIVWAIEKDTSGFSRMAENWRAGFALADHGGATHVTALSSFEPSNLMVSAAMPLIRRKFHQTQRAILNGLKHASEADPS